MAFDWIEAETGTLNQLRAAILSSALRIAHLWSSRFYRMNLFCCRTNNRGETSRKPPFANRRSAKLFQIWQTEIKLCKHESYTDAKILQKTLRNKSSSNMQIREWIACRESSQSSPLENHWELVSLARDGKQTSIQVQTMKSRASLGLCLIAHRKIIFLEVAKRGTHFTIQRDRAFSVAH